MQLRRVMTPVLVVVCVCVCVKQSSHPAPVCSGGSRAWPDPSHRIHILIPIVPCLFYRPQTCGQVRRVCRCPIMLFGPSLAVKISGNKVWFGLCVCLFCNPPPLSPKQKSSVKLTTPHNEDPCGLRLSPLFSSTWLNFIITWLVFFCNVNTCDFKVDRKCYALGNSRFL